MNDGLIITKKYYYYKNITFNYVKNFRYFIFDLIYELLQYI